MFLTEVENEIIVYLRNPLSRFRFIASGKTNPVKAASDDAILSLYYKMDDVITKEGESKRALGDYDEFYILQLSGVKQSLLDECRRRDIPVDA